jgi:MerR family transcriptional regulator, light-induced transcriptional regulator
MIERSQGFLTPKDLARAIGVSESSLKRWVDEGLLRASRTAGGHRRIAVADAVRFIRETRSPVLRPELLGFRGVDLAAAAAAGTTSRSTLFEAFASDDQPTARGIVVAAFLSGAPISTLCDGTIRVAFERLGELWLDGPAGIVLEHRAVDTTMQTISLMRAAVPPAPAGAPIALGGAFAGDPYVLPSMCAALVLADAGYVDVNLGADVPTDPLLDAIERYRPALVWRSVSTAEDPSRLRRDAIRLAERLRSTGAHLVVGGRGSSELAPLASDRVHVLGSMGELAAFSRGLSAVRAGAETDESGPPPAP